MQLLIITRHRLNENNGGANATKGIIHCFTTLFKECTLICPSFKGEAIDFIPANVKVLSYDDHRNKIHKGLDVWRGKICANTLFVRQHLNEKTYDLVVIDHSFTGASLVRAIKSTGAKVITIHHNVERYYLYDNRKQYSLTYRFPYIYFARKAEKECLYNSDINITLTEKDAQVFRSWNNVINTHLHTWGIYEYRPFATKFFVPKKRKHQFVITGSLNFIQSLTPISEFICNYWPIIKNDYPDAQLTIAGKNPSKLLYKKCFYDDQIKIIPNPDDIEAIVRQADYYICPINMGSGLKLRILDGLKQGLPILCHEVSAAGYEPLKANHCIFTYSDKQSFINSLHEMMTTHVSSTAVYDSFKQLFSIQTGCKKLYEILNKEHII